MRPFAGISFHTAHLFFTLQFNPNMCVDKSDIPFVQSRADKMLAHTSTSITESKSEDDEPQESSSPLTPQYQTD